MIIYSAVVVVHNKMLDLAACFVIQTISCTLLDWLRTLGYFFRTFD